VTAQKPRGHRLIIGWSAGALAHAPSHKYGGFPSTGAALPKCSGCGQPHHLLFEIDLTDPQLAYLGLSGVHYLFITSCLDCATYEHVTYYSLDREGREVTVLQESPSVYVPQYPHPLDERPVSCRPLYDNEYPVSDDAVAAMLSQEGKHQLGGIPIWVQHAMRIPCLSCGLEMQYIAMVDSELYVGEDGFRDRGHMFGDEGTLYVFVCRDCGVFAAKAQGL
jgi:uncharacterized protein YwqG